jgi:hypothetical protein
MGLFSGEAWAEKRPEDEFEVILNRLFGILEPLDAAVPLQLVGRRFLERFLQPGYSVQQTG